MTTLSSLKPVLDLSAMPVSKPMARPPQSDHQAVVIPEISQPTSMAERWASYVLEACKSGRDPRTLAIWARQVGVSYTTLCESCRLIDVQPRHARDFTRILRIMLVPAFDFRQLPSFLDISDKRTLNSILQTAGLGQHASISRHISIGHFLDNQRFIARENPGLIILRDVFCRNVALQIQSSQKSDKYSSGNWLASDGWPK
jgi:hypothetical protein